MRLRLYTMSALLGVAAAGVGLLVWHHPARSNQQEWAVVKKYCFDCHNYEEQAGNRAFDKLSPDHIAQIWQEKVQAMFGDSLELTADHLPWWSYVGHFIRVPGYVYAYAFGNLLALSIYQRYREVGPEFVDTYLDFLGAGGSQAPDELVRSVGMDITDPGFWDAGLQILDGMVGQVEQLSKT